MPKDSKHNSIKDSDADGLLDSEEKKLGTNPYDPDTDHDGLGDYIEAKVYHTDPLKKDTDCDGVDDGHEVKLGRNPLGKGALKDLFIPHKCNNYRPKALRPKRILFHAISAVTIKVVMVGFLMIFPLEAYLTPNVLQEQSQRIVALTNGTRASLNLNNLQNNLTLQQAATKKVEDMLVNEYFAHISPENKGLRHFLTTESYSFSVAGENLALGFSEADDVYQAWLNSPTHYANIIDPDYEEIGVAMVAGNYKGYETTLAAQYFGTPKTSKNTIEIEPVEPIEEPVVVPEPNTNVLSEKEDNIIIVEPVEPIEEPVVVPEPEVVEVVEEPAEEPILLVEVDQELNNNTVLYTPDEITVEEPTEEIFPSIDHEQTKISVYKPANEETVVINVTAVLSEDTVKATAQISNYSIELSRTSLESNEWSGSKILKEKQANKEIFDPVTLATITVENSEGNTLTEDINWENITPNKSTALSQYMFAKKFPSEFIEPLFDYTSVYFLFVLLFTLIALIINIAVQFKRQHHDIILSSFGFLILLTFLVAF